MKTYLLASEDFATSYNLSEIDTLSPAIYNIYENGQIKHNHNLVIDVESNMYYVVSFDRLVDIDLSLELNNNTKFFIETKEVKKHLCTFSDKLYF